MEINEDRLGYYAEAAGIPLNVQKAYYSYSEEMVNFIVLEIAAVVDGFKEDCITLIKYIHNLLSYIVGETSHNLFDYACAQGREMRRKGDVPKEMQGLLEEILGEVSFQYQELGRHMDIPDWIEG